MKEEIINLRVRVKISYNDNEGKKLAIKRAKENTLSANSFGGNYTSESLTVKQI